MEVVRMLKLGLHDGDHEYCIVVRRGFGDQDGDAVNVQLWNPKANKNEIKKYQEWMEKHEPGETGYKTFDFQTKLDGEIHDSWVQLIYCDGYARIGSGGMWSEVPLNAGIQVITMMAQFFAVEEEEEEDDKEENENNE